jgi:hypothetical protein
MFTAILYISSRVRVYSIYSSLFIMQVYFMYLFYFYSINGLVIDKGAKAHVDSTNEKKSYRVNTNKFFNTQEQVSIGLASVGRETSRISVVTKEQDLF